LLRGFPPAPGKDFPGTRQGKENLVIANALIVTIAILLAVGFWLMGQLRFLIPYRHILFHRYGAVIFLGATVLFVNVFAAVYVIQRKFFLKDTGRKLSHVDKQALVGRSLVPTSHPSSEVR
jgi:hypothetical protein